MTTKGIKSEFTKHIKKSMGSENPRLNNWDVGITNIEQRRKAEHQNKLGKIKYWKCLNAGALNSANEIEVYFNSKGTTNLPFKNGAIKKSKLVYIFKLPARKKAGLNGAFIENSILEEIFG